MITGLLVPGSITGVELIRRVRAAAPSIPIIVVTACLVEDIWREAQDAGCDEVLLKPCLPDRVLNAGRCALNVRVAARLPVPSAIPTGYTNADFGPWRLLRSRSCLAQDPGVAVGYCGLAATN